MKEVPADYMAVMQEHGASMAMDVDDDPLDIFGEGYPAPDTNKLADTDFFNSFSDDFDDSDIN
ncbi:hypothetical protein RND81_14G064600 [Saponaria officinalis]|uniref:Small acidic protein 1 n=1 Tax=Saponaria officinalis TaxID=3572 RepID=A0AAW1GJ86_SAPOF